VIGAAQIVSAPMAAAQTFQPHNAPVQSPWYIEGSSGLIWRMDASRSTTFFNLVGPPVSGPGTNTIAFDPGYNLNLGVGYKLPWGFRAEIEGNYSHYTVSSLSPLSTDGTFPVLNGSRLNVQSGGDRNEYGGTLNAFYDLPISASYVPYIGAGGGIETINADTVVVAGPGGVPRFTEAGGNATDAIILAEVGVTIALNEKWSVVPSYRFQHVFTNGSAFPDNANIFKVGIRYSP
jgi:opacity protein-like surface antigen